MIIIPLKFTLKTEPNYGEVYLERTFEVFLWKNIIYQIIVW